MMVNGKQMSITWHVNDSKIFHVDADEVKKLIDWIKGIYGSFMKESRGKKQYYLRIDRDLSVDREVRLTMTDYLKNILSDFPETIHGIVTTPGAEHLFIVR